MDTKISEAWLEAATKLGIRVTAPYELPLGNGETLRVEAFLPDFGGYKGAVLVAISEDDRAERARASGCFISQLGADYRQFDDELFRLTLDDWGWYGPADQQPPWHEGPSHPG